MDRTREQTLRRTALFDRHLAAGAKMVDFAGWEMPVFYALTPDRRTARSAPTRSGATARDHGPSPDLPVGAIGLRTTGSAPTRRSSPINHEHMAVRRSCGMFDVSHMGEIQTAGPDALAFLQRLLSNDIARIEVGGAQYSVMCREDGGVLDDLFTYRLDTDRYLTVTNAANHRGDLAWFGAHAGDLRVTVEDRIRDFAMIALQGPRAREVVAPLLDEGDLPPRMTATTCRLAGARVLVCGTGYTGEDGVELLVAPEDAPAIWDRLLAGGATPAGLAARDTLRIEACFHLYGNDLSVQRGPIEAGLGWCCHEDTGFIGAEAVRSARGAAQEAAERTAAGGTETGAVWRLIAFALSEEGIPRQGNPIIGGGEVTSGTLSPCLGVGIGLGYVPIERSATGIALTIDVRGKIREAIVKAKPLYRKGS